VTTIRPRHRDRYPTWREVRPASGSSAVSLGRFAQAQAHCARGLVNAERGPIVERRVAASWCWCGLLPEPWLPPSTTASGCTPVVLRRAAAAQYPESTIAVSERMDAWRVAGKLRVLLTPSGQARPGRAARARVRPIEMRKARRRRGRPSHRERKNARWCGSNSAANNSADRSSRTSTRPAARETPRDTAAGISASWTPLPRIGRRIHERVNSGRDGGLWIRDFG
jgi:hypothetical protein